MEDPARAIAAPAPGVEADLLRGEPPGADDRAVVLTDLDEHEAGI